MHFHALVLDGVYEAGGRGAFRPALPPDRLELERVLRRVARRLDSLLDRRAEMSTARLDRRDAIVSHDAAMRRAGEIASLPAWWRRGLPVLLAASLLLYLAAITWGLPAYSSWSNDDIAPLGPLRAARELFATYTKYPPVHYALLALINSGYVAYLVLSGGMDHPQADFPYGFKDPLVSLTVCMMLDRLVSVCMGVGVVYFVVRATRRLTRDRRAALLAGAAAAVNAHVVLFSHLSNVDIPALFWLALAFNYFVRLIRTWREGDAVRLALAAALAVGTKEHIYSYLAGMAIVLLGSWRRRARPWRPLGAGLGVFVAAYALVNNLFFGWSVYSARLSFWIGGPGVSRYPEVEATTSGQVALLGKFVRLLLDGAGAPMLLAAVAGLVVAARFRRRAIAPLLVPALLYYAGSVASIRFAYERFTLPWVLIVAPLAGIALARLVPAGSPMRAPRRIAAAATLAFSLLWGGRVDLDLLLDARYDAEAYLRARVPRSAAVEVYSFPSYLPRLAEMGYNVHRVNPEQDPHELFTAGALAARAPDVVVLTTNYFPRFGLPLRAYFEDLLAGRMGYTATAFAGGPAWLGSRRHPREFARVNPTIYVLERAPVPF